jgi:hypothetical protein
MIAGDVINQDRMIFRATGHVNISSSMTCRFEASAPSSFLTIYCLHATAVAENLCLHFPNLFLYRECRGRMVITADSDNDGHGSFFLAAGSVLTSNSHDIQVCFPAHDPSPRRASNLYLNNFSRPC